jgi:NAD(P)-dependent dehydrogenase (short-subunit alcohol dehydrogenase family)
VFYETNPYTSPVIQLNLTVMTSIEKTSNITGRSVLITGGTTGIGREIALQLAALGCNVLISGRDERHLEETLNDIRQSSSTSQINGIIADVSTSEGITKLFEEADSLFGGKLDVMINNAALAAGSATEGSYEEWQQVVNTNLLSYIACSNFAIKRMADVPNAHIVYIGSMSADVRETGSSVYVATKAGIQGFAESLRNEINKQGIRVTLIEPGAVDTDMQPDETEEKKSATERHEMLTASDIAGAVIYALSQDARCDVVEIRLRPRLQLI